VSSDKPLKHFGLALLIALVVYFGAYTWIEHRRNRNGPWQVTFTNQASGDPSIVINEPALRITNVQLVFVNTGPVTNSSEKLSFAQPRRVPYAVPFGQCVFMDTTFLPGTLTLEIFGHQVELLPRVLVIDRKEYPWHSNTNISLVAHPSRL
jgi:hypothetical protein